MSIRRREGPVPGGCEQRSSHPAGGNAPWGHHSVNCVEGLRKLSTCPPHGPAVLIPGTTHINEECRRAAPWVGERSYNQPCMGDCRRPASSRSSIHDPLSALCRGQTQRNSPGKQLGQSSVQMCQGFSLIPVRACVRIKQ